MQYSGGYAGCFCRSPKSAVLRHSFYKIAREITKAIAENGVYGQSAERSVGVDSLYRLKIMPLKSHVNYGIRRYAKINCARFRDRKCRCPR